MVTGRLTVDADALGRLDLRLGGVAANYCPQAHSWFVEAYERLGIRPGDESIQWNALVKVTALTGTPPDQVGDTDFVAVRAAIVEANMARDLPESGRGMASALHPAPAHALSRRASHQPRPTDEAPIGVGERLVCGHARVQPTRPAAMSPRST